MENENEELLKEYEYILQKIAEYKLIKNILNEIKKQDETFIHLGGMVFVKGSIKEDNYFLVNIGENIFIEKSKDEIIKLLDDLISQFESRKKEIEEALSK